MSSLSLHLAAQHVWMPGIYALALSVFPVGISGKSVCQHGARKRILRPDASEPGRLPQRIQEITSADKDVKKRQPLRTIGRNVNWCLHYEGQYGGASEY